MATIQQARTLGATRIVIVASTLAGLASAAGVLHGCFELLQGHVAPTGRVVNAMGPDQVSSAPFIAGVLYLWSAAVEGRSVPPGSTHAGPEDRPKAA